MERAKKLEGYQFSVLIFALAALAFGLKSLLKLENVWAYYLAAVVTFLAAFTTIAAIVHYWRYWD